MSTGPATEARPPARDWTVDTTQPDRQHPKPAAYSHGRSVLGPDGWIVHEPNDPKPFGPLLSDMPRHGPWDVTSGPPLREWEIDERVEHARR